MSPLAWGVLGLLILSESERREKMTTTKPANRYVQDLIRAEAVRLDVPAAFALAVADIESGFDPNAKGDLNWSQRNGGALYRVHVLENARLRNNPARSDPSAWHSYGVFQLLAPYHVRPTEDPRALYDVPTNVSRGVRFLKGLLEAAHGNQEAARLAYIGCGFDGALCDHATVTKARERLRAALQRWGEGVG
jgi:hypothetical protein